MSDASVGALSRVANYQPQILVAIGLTVVLGGIFLTLACHQVLPHGVNAISNLGFPGQVMSYGTLGLGGVITLIGAIKWFLADKTESPSPPVLESVENTQKIVEEEHLEEKKSPVQEVVRVVEEPPRVVLTSENPPLVVEETVYFKDPFPFQEHYFDTLRTFQFPPHHFMWNQRRWMTPTPRFSNLGLFPRRLVRFFR